MGKLKQKDEIIDGRLSATSRYRKNLQDHPNIKLLPKDKNCQTINYVMPVFVENRDKIKEELLKAGISTMIHYPIPCHLQPAFHDYGYGVEGQFPVAEKQCKTELSLPLFYGITNEEIDYVSYVLIKCCRNLWKKIYERKC